MMAEKMKLMSFKDRALVRSRFKGVVWLMSALMVAGAARLPIRPAVDDKSANSTTSLSQGRLQLCSTKEKDVSADGSNSVSLSTTTTTGPCEWFLHAAFGQMLLVSIDSIIIDGRSAGTLTLTMDGNVTTIGLVSSVTQHVDKNRGSAVELSGRSLQLLWSPNTAGAAASGNNDTTTSSSTFTLRYAIFESDFCQVPEDVENVVIEGAGTSIVDVDTAIRYTCVGTWSPPIVLHAQCVLKFDSSTSRPSWSHPPPVCPRHQDSCRDGLPIKVRLQQATNGSQILAYDGRLGVDRGCSWEVEAAAANEKLVSSFVVVHVEWFDVDQDGDWRQLSLEFYDGERVEGRLLKRFRGDSAAAGQLPATFVSLHGKIVVALNVSSQDGDVEVELGKNATGYDWYARFVSIPTSTSCQPTLLNAPVNGDVRGSQLTSDVNSPTAIAIFTCNDGYRLVGSERSECTASGGWSVHTPPTCQPQGSDEVIVVGSDKTVARMPQQPRQNKLSRPHPQSTEEKGYKKSPAAKETTDVVAVKAQNTDDVLLSTVSPLQEKEEEAMEEAGLSDPDINWRIGSGQIDYENSLSGYSELDDEYKDHQFFETHRAKEGEQDDNEERIEVGDSDGGIYADSIPVMAIVLAVTLPLLAFTVVLVSCLVYRKLYPVRMGPGRRFETFENPIYGRSGKRGSSIAGQGHASLASPERLAQNPAELERLTTTNFSVST